MWTCLQFFQRSERSESLLRLPNLGVLYREDESPEHLALTASGDYFWESQRAAEIEWLKGLKKEKKDLYICCLQETHFRSKIHRLKVRGWKKGFHANENKKKAE